MKLSPPAARSYDGLPRRARQAVSIALFPVVGAGFDVAAGMHRRACDLALQLLACPLALRPEADGAMLSASTRPAARRVADRDRRAALMVHALDTGLPVAAGIASDEALFDAGEGGRFSFRPPGGHSGNRVRPRAHPAPDPGDMRRVDGGRNCMRSGGIGALLLMWHSTDVPGVADVALGLALLTAAFRDDQFRQPPQNGQNRADPVKWRSTMFSIV